MTFKLALHLDEESKAHLVSEINNLSNEFNSTIHYARSCGIKTELFSESIQEVMQIINSNRTVFEIFEQIYWRSILAEYHDLGPQETILFTDDEGNQNECRFPIDHSVILEATDELSRQILKIVNHKFNDLFVHKFHKYWYLLFTVISLDEARLVLRKREEINSSQRKICSEYYFLAIQMRKHFFDLEFESEHEGNSFTVPHTYFKPNNENVVPVHYQQYSADMLQGKISKFQMKFTVFQRKFEFINEFQRSVNINEISQTIQLYIDNCFHFDGEEWTGKLQPNDLPLIKASKFAIFLRGKWEDKKISRANKEDLILWLAYEHYGASGFKYDNLHKYFRNTYLTKRHKEMKKTINNKPEPEDRKKKNKKA